MISRLVGELVEKGTNDIIVDVNGVGYEVFVTQGVSQDLGPVGAKVSLTVYTDVRENAILLYGFTNKTEKQTFLLLKKVKGIGSKLAMVILSYMKPEELMIAIGKGEATYLTKVPGIGKKSAERIILELREQVVEFVKESETLTKTIEVSALRKDGSGSSVVFDDAILALQKLGFSKEVAFRAVNQANTNNPKLGNDVGSLLKESLSFLG